MKILNYLRLLRCLIHIHVHMRNMADFIADARIHEVEFSAEPTGHQGVLGHCDTTKTIYFKDDVWHFQKEQT